MSAAAATLVTVRPQAAPLPRYRLLPAKTVPALCIIPAVLKPAPNRAKKTATVLVLPSQNAAVDVLLDIPVKMEAVLKILPVVMISAELCIIVPEDRPIPPVLAEEDTVLICGLKNICVTTS